MKYIRKFANRRELADHERTMDKYNWFMLDDIGTTAPAGFTPVTSGAGQNCYDTLALITDSVLASGDIQIYRVGTSSYRYYRRIPYHMVWRVISFKRDNGTIIVRGNDSWGEEKGIVGYYYPNGIVSDGDFLLQDFNNDFLVPLMSSDYHWVEIESSSLPSGYTFTTGQDTCASISEVEPITEDDFLYMKDTTANKYYMKTAD